MDKKKSITINFFIYKCIYECREEGFQCKGLVQVREAGAKLAAADLHRGEADTALLGGENLPLSCVGFYFA